MFCLGCSDGTYDPYAPKNIALQTIAVLIMVEIDIPVCHRLTNIASFAASALTSNIISMAEYIGYHHPNHKLDGKKSLSTEIIHHNLYSAIEMLENETHEHDVEHHHTFLTSKLEVFIELSIGIIASILLPAPLVKMAHNIDIMHIIPGWGQLESTAPDISNGHGVAEAIAYLISVIGPINDIIFRGFDPKQVQQAYWEESFMSAAASCYDDMPRCWRSIGTFLQDSFGHKEHVDMAEIIYYSDDMANIYCLDA